MTTIQSMILSMCFGIMIGMLTANMVCMVRFATEEQKERRCKRKKEEEFAMVLVYKYGHEKLNNL